MTKNGMTKREKDVTEGMIHILNQDVCAPFECPSEGCDECPLHNAAVILNKAITALADIPMIEG